MKRWLTALLIVVVLGTAAVSMFLWLRSQVTPPIRVGILHSKTGAMKISEESMIEAEQLAVKEINEHGGLLGRQVEWVIADGCSDWPTFAQGAAVNRCGKRQCDLWMLDVSES